MTPDRELDRLVSELNASNIRGANDASRLEEWLATLRARGGSDLYLVSGVPPTIRVNGVLRSLAEPPIDGDEIENAVLPALPLHAVERYRRHGIADHSAGAPAAGSGSTCIANADARPRAFARCRSIRRSWPSSACPTASKR